MEGYPQPAQRAILNANRGVSNVIEQKVINTDLRRVTDNLFNVLLHHYGPYSGFAAVDDGQPLNETNFTKDGIGIVRAIEYASPQEEWVRKTIAYIGAKMESSVGDGTTSAMMFTCAMLRHMSEHIDELKPLSYHKFRSQFDDFVKIVTQQIKKRYTSTAFDLIDGKEVINRTKLKHIVYNQTYTSSHGDHELATALADLYALTPKELWPRMTYERRRYESDQRFEVVQSEGQYQMQAEVMQSAMLNKDLCTWFEKENCSLVIINDSLRINSPDWPNIEKMIKEATEVRPVVIVCHTVMDNETYDTISKLFEDCAKAGNPFALFSAKPEHHQINDFAALQLIAGSDTIQFAHGEAVVVDGCKVKYKGKKLSIDNISEVPEAYKDSLERHQAIDGQHGAFTDHLDAWKNQAEMYSKQVMDAEQRQWANYYNRMYVKLRYKKTSTVVIGGKSYDNVAFVDVLDDALRAASRALTYGATLGNNRALYRVVSAMSTSQRTTRTGAWFAKMVKLSLEDIARVVLKRLYPKKFFFSWQKKDFVDWWFSHSVDLLLYDTKTVLNRKKFCSWRNQAVDFSSVDGQAFSTFSMDQLFESDGFICQPSNSDTTMLERFGEIALKFILTERVIIRGGAYVDKKRK